MKYILLVCVWQRGVDYSLYTLEDQCVLLPHKTQQDNTNTSTTYHHYRAVQHSINSTCRTYRQKLLSNIGRQQIGKKGKKAYLYSAFYILCISQSAQAWITQFYLQIHHACLSFASVHQTAPPPTEVRAIQLQLTTHLSTPKGWKAELAWLDDL